jgi:hypothetical protein
MYWQNMQSIFCLKNRSCIILKEFELSNVDPKPYAYAKDITGEATSKLVNQENTIQTKRVLSKNDWLNLQAICGG